MRALYKDPEGKEVMKSNVGKGAGELAGSDKSGPSTSSTNDTTGFPRKPSVPSTSE